MSAPSGANLLGHQLRVSALEAEATRVQRFARDAPIGILFVASDGTVQLANDEYLRIAGRSREEFDAQRFSLEPRALPRWVNPELGPRYETECVRPDGTRVPVLVGLSSEGDGLAAFVVDLTAEKAAERARQETEERYRATAERLAEADRRKDEFLSILSHELRNPLAPIQNALHLLERAGDDPARDARARAVIERQVGHLSRLVDDLLDVTRISRGRVVLHRERLDMARVVRETVEDHRPMFEAAALDLEARLPPTAVPVDADPTRLAQVVGNLLANSARFTPPGGRISVVLEDDAAGATLFVRDTGEGIDPEVLPRIFEPFSQADRSLARTRGGLGLGLAIVKGLVELHGGTATVSSPGRGAGTEVAVRLPRAPDLPQAAPEGGAVQRSAHVLVVEDNRDAAETLRDALELEGMKVTVARDGRAGLEAARRTAPDVVLCDIGLPGDLDGYDMARAIRADPALRDLPLVAVTGYAGPEDRARAREAGFERHLAKPATIESLLEAIASVRRD